MMSKTLIGVICLSILLYSFTLSTTWFGSKVDYNADVKPILNKHCMGCHGGVKKAGDVSFLFEHEMLEPGKSGKIPVVRGDADASEMIRRILTDDPDEKMPKNSAPLSDNEVDVLKQWINEGAKWETHWSYKRIEKPDVPSTRSLWNLFGLLNWKESSWPKNEIDHFIIEKAKNQGLSTSSEANKPTLIRRLSLDLTGLPPTKEEVAAFEKDGSADAYEKVVDRLLGSPAYGERWAGMWMDLARYADTKGYEKDGGRSIWRYRDYVVKSFNSDKPFDQFTIEQLAGDLLPKKQGLPAQEHLVATGFHRNTMNNDEGGTSDEEFRVAAQIDRVNTTWEVWQGTTFACIQCHSHPYDPISHDEYYKYMAFFNNTRDEDVPSDSPTMRFYKGEDSARVQRVMDWITRHEPEQASQVSQFVHITEPKINSHDFKIIGKSTLLDGKYLGLKQKTSARLPAVSLTGMSQLVVSIGTQAENALLTIKTDTLAKETLAQFKVPTTGYKDTVLVVPINQVAGKHDLYFTLESPKMPDKWVQIKWLSFQKALPGKDQANYEETIADYSQLLTSKTDETPILWESAGDMVRKTNVFVRGNWLVKGAEVKPDIPKLLTPMPKEYARNRLGLARWMVHRDNALTSRVIVNRFWEQLFGRGIVETVEDFGSQGSAPSHPELLDWLAVEFMTNYRWSVKLLLKQMVMSATYRQDSRSDKEKTEKDPENMWLTRGPRVRLSAEQIRDQALAVSGLLSTKMYGPGVMPPQPDGIWLSPYSGETWVPSQGEDKHRRAIYTYWKRTAPYPSMMTFDSPSREFCQSRRIRTNTPLQALVTLNDPVYMEAAVQLALKMRGSAPTPQQQLRAGYRMVTFQPVSEKKLAALLNIYESALIRYKSKPADVDSVLVYSAQKSPELAALAVSANVLLNLDGAVTKE
ncbi:DUF1553 domain-containing protein [Dyadobacter sp.]|uniref:DUF1553 domain-containing protein n=1 Tax=Dyadobacter sp. TaxID=1914288 RepID=UPI003F6FC015